MKFIYSNNGNKVKVLCLNDDKLLLTDNMYKNSFFFYKVGILNKQNWRVCFMFLDKVRVFLPIFAVIGYAVEIKCGVQFEMHSFFLNAISSLIDDD